MTTRISGRVTFCALYAILLLLPVVLCIGLSGCHNAQKQPVQLYDPGKEAQEKAVEAQEQANYKKMMHDRHMPGY